MKEIILFGGGDVGKNAIKHVKHDYHILFLADNDEKKWGTSLEDYIVKSPEEIRNYDCDVVIASARYGVEIAEQLERMTVIRERIYFYRDFDVKVTCGYEIYPAGEEKVMSAGQPLCQYDLYHETVHAGRTADAERSSAYKKVLIFCTFYSTYTKQLIENMSKRCKDIEFSLITATKEYQEKITAGQLEHLYYFQTMADLKTILEQLPVYDAMQLLWIEREWAYFYKLIRKKAVRLNLNVGGSDFYRTGKGEKDFKKNLIACADTVTAETETTVREFQDYYGSIVENKMGLLPFGIEVLELIERCGNQSKSEIREKYHIPPEKKILTCGHNANDAHQHMGIIEVVNRLPERIKEQIVCVFPMTYPQGRETYIHEVESRLKKTGLQYVILKEFMDFQGMAEYALISDIMLHVQKTDQLSSTMLEEMYAGTIVIAGKWLPYQSLHEMGMFFLDIDRIEDAAAALETVIPNLAEYQKKCERNKNIVWKHSSWEELAARWRALWDEKQPEDKKDVI